MPSYRVHYSIAPHGDKPALMGSVTVEDVRDARQAVIQAKVHVYGETGWPPVNVTQAWDAEEVKR